MDEHKENASVSVLAVNRMLALACDSYQWSDHGATINITVPLPDSISASDADRAIQCCFQRDAVHLTMMDGTAAQHVLRLQPLAAPVVPERCTWRLHNGCHFPKAVAGKDYAMDGAIVIAGTQPWAVKLTLCKEDSSVTWSSLVREACLPRSESSHPAENLLAWHGV